MTTALSLATYTDRAAMRALLQTYLPGYASGRWQIDGLDVRNARRSTSRSRNPRPMTVCYELQVREPAAGRTGTQLLYAEVYREDTMAQALDGRTPTNLTAPAFGDPLVHLPELGLVLWALPNDPSLPQLPVLLDADRAAAHVPGAAGRHLRLDLLRYEPCQRATLRYSLVDGVNQPAGTVYAKTFRDERAALIDERFRWFWSRAKHDHSQPLVAEPLGHDQALRTVWQSSAPGTPLRHRLAHADAPLLMAGVARALAVLHAAPLAPSPTALPRDQAHWLGEVRRRRNKIARINPALTDRVDRIARAIETDAQRRARPTLSLIHGDWHPDQVWIHGGRPVLFDFDDFTYGDPMEDVAEFVCKLEGLGAGPALVTDFIDHYAKAAPDRFNPANLAWHLAIQGLLQAARAFVYQLPDWPRTLQQRLADCEARLGLQPTVPEERAC